jgi:hypothetical protein
MPRSAPYEKSKCLGSGGSMVARLKLKEIDGRAPQGVNFKAVALRQAPAMVFVVCLRIFFLEVMPSLCLRAWATSSNCGEISPSGERYSYRQGVGCGLPGTKGNDRGMVITL